LECEPLRILKGLVAVCHENDPTRPVTQALFRPNVSHDYDNGLADMLDVIGTHYRDQELLAAWQDKPTRKIIGTEQGHGRDIWLACRNSPQHAGQFLWSVVDEQGVPVPTAADLITFKIAGPGVIAAVDSGSIASHEPFQASQRKAFQGRCVAMVKAAAASGRISLTATADGLTGVPVAFEAVSAPGDSGGKL